MGLNCLVSMILMKKAFLNVGKVRYQYFNPLPDMPISGFSNSAANQDMMSKIWTDGDTII